MNVYDLLLNFNKEYYDFYEWQKEDNILHIKKIPLIRVDKVIYDDFLGFQIVFPKDFLEMIHNKCEYFTKGGIKEILYAVLITDSFRVMGLMIDSSGKIKKYSSLLLDEEEEVLEMSGKLPIIKINYDKLSTKRKNPLTREDSVIQSFIKKDLEDSIKRNDLNKLRYLYYEYFNQYIDNDDQIKKELLNEVMHNFNEKHLELYQLIKLSLRQNNV